MLIALVISHRFLLYLVDIFCQVMFQRSERGGDGGDGGDGEVDGGLEDADGGEGYIRCHSGL